MHFFQIPPACARKVKESETFARKTQKVEMRNSVKNTLSVELCELAGMN